jgi:hypothetical protein
MYCATRAERFQLLRANYSVVIIRAVSALFWPFSCCFVLFILQRRNANRGIRSLTFLVLAEFTDNAALPATSCIINLCFCILLFYCCADLYSERGQPAINSMRGDCERSKIE